ncbi:hypothetical protein C4579_04485 [Candidatus Microgenomates bacterium]|nr:MAG: hypothetical protein C4579_04485 [Candidatus Microgenomates bacterium]
MASFLERLHESGMNFVPAADVHVAQIALARRLPDLFAEDDNTLFELIRGATKLWWHVRTEDHGLVVLAATNHSLFPGIYLYQHQAVFNTGGNVSPDQVTALLYTSTPDQEEQKPMLMIEWFGRMNGPLNHLQVDFVERGSSVHVIPDESGTLTTYILNQGGVVGTTKLHGQLAYIQYDRFPIPQKSGRLVIPTTLTFPSPNSIPAETSI